MTAQEIKRNNEQAAPESQQIISPPDETSPITPPPPPPPPPPHLPNHSILTSETDVVNTDTIALRQWYPLALGMMALPFWCLLVAVFGFIVWIPITKYHFIAAFALTLGTIAWGCHWNQKRSLLQCGLFTIVMLLCGFYALLSMENGFDALSYHKPAVIEMKNGWNPIWEYDTKWDPHSDKENGFWYTHVKYNSKSDWYINAVFYAFSGNGDLGHLTRMFYMFATFVVVFAALALMFHLPGYQCLFLALIAVLNPWTIQQCFHGNIDGALGSCLTILFFAFAAYLKSKDKRFFPFIAASIVIGTNLKITGVVYAAVFLICMLIPYILLGIRAKKPVDRLLAGTLVLATVLALIAGINPYLHHLYRHYTPFYPIHVVREVDKVRPRANVGDIAARQAKVNVGKANRLQQFVFYYLNTSDSRSMHDPTLKPVHTITVEKVPFGRNNTPYSFGNLFMVPMWFSLLMMPLIRRKESWILLIAVWASIWVCPYIWYGRFIPHLWVIPVIVAAALLSQFNGLPEYRLRVIVIVSAVLLCMFVGSLKMVSSMIRHHLASSRGVAYFVLRQPQALFFDVEGLANSDPGWKFVHTTKTYISDLLPDYSFDKPLNTDDPKTRLTKNFMRNTSVYLVAENKKELARLKSIKPSTTKQIRAILYIRAEQFKRVWVGS